MQQGNTWTASYAGAVDFGTFTNNYYFNPFSDVPIHQQFHYDVAGVTSYLKTPIVPWTLAQWQATGGDRAAMGSPLKLLDHLVQDTSEIAVPEHTDECGPTVPTPDPWLNASSPIAGDGADGTYRRFVDQPFVERWGGVPPAYTTPVDSLGPTPPDAVYRFTFRMRSPNTTAIQLAPLYLHPQYTAPLLHAAIREDWTTQVRLAHVPVTDAEMVTAFQNTQYGLGALSASTIDVDYVRVERVTLDPDYPTDVIAQEHILRYYCPLDGTAALPGNTAATGGEFTVPGTTGQCWSDVHGNFYAAGDDIELDPWASIVLFRMDVPNAGLTLNGSGEYHVSGTEVWDTHRNVVGKIVVNEGDTLIVDGAHIGFAATTKPQPTNIKVQPGGQLIVRNGGHLRNWMGCDAPAELWDGVEVYSQQTLSPAAIKVGRVDLTTGATVSNAKAGVMAGSGDPANASAGLPRYWAGGTITADNARFFNNRYSVVAKSTALSFFPVHVNNGPTGGYQYEPQLTRCAFITNRALLGNVAPKAHVRYYNQWQPGIRGCTFANTRTDLATSSAMGHGIDLFNSGARISPTGAGPNTFSNLGHAVRLMDASYHPMKYLVVNGNTFTNNICGTFVSGAVGTSIVNNTFEVGRWDVDMDLDDEVLWDENHRAIFTTSSYAFQIRDNAIAPSAQADPSVQKEGIVVGFTQDHNDVVWKNTASGMDRAFVGEGISADLSNENTIGLQFHCNTNNGNATNLMSRVANGEDDPNLHTIRGFQGADTLAAGNGFDQHSGGLDFEMTTEYVPVIKYYYDDGVADQEPIYYTQITGVSEVDPMPLTSEDNACDVNPYEGGGGSSSSMMQGLSENRETYESLREEYDSLIDGGDTEALIAQINGTWNQDVADLRSQLLAISPFVSTEALKALMDQPAVPDSVKLEIYAANPDATSTGGFLTWAEADAFQSMDVADMAEIAATWNTTTARTTMEQQLAQRHSNLTRSVSYLLHHLRTDSTAPDSIRWVWQQLRTNAARYAEAGLLMSVGNHAEALAVVEAMPQERRMSAREEAERGRMVTYISVLQGAAEDDRDAYDLTPTEVETLKGMVGTHYDRPSVWASNLLCAAYGHCRAPYTGGSGGDPKQLILPQEELAPLPASSALRLYPNPANGGVTMSYHLPGHSGIVHLVVRDASGRVLVQLNAAGEQGQRIWDMRGIAPGIYTVELHRGRYVERTERLVIQP
jgi:hypothetical protein